MRSDEILLLDMLLAARDGVEFTRSCTRADFERDRMRQFGYGSRVQSSQRTGGQSRKSLRSLSAWLIYSAYLTLHSGNVKHHTTVRSTFQLEKG